MDPPNLPPCFKVAHLFGFVDNLLFRFFGPTLTYLGSKRLKLFPVTSRGSLSQTSLPKNKWKTRVWEVLVKALSTIFFRYNIDRLTRNIQCTTLKMPVFFVVGWYGG